MKSKQKYLKKPLIIRCKPIIWMYFVKFHHKKPKVHSNMNQIISSGYLHIEENLKFPDSNFKKEEVINQLSRAITPYL